MRIRKAVFSVAFAALTTVAFSSVGAMSRGGPGSQVQDFALQQQLQQIESLARAKGVVLQDLQVHRSVKLGANTAGQLAARDEGKSCTVTAQVSATAPTCEEAAAMVASYVISIGAPL
ncbi:MAG TPA: hypothetical protein VFW82_01485 [Dyella sp.]|nr:hypothetical protein [Dyella sp.]